MNRYPDLDENGISTVMSCVTDISSLKWSEAQLRRRMEDAIEMKKKQERFIDVSSPGRLCLGQMLTVLDDLA